MSEERNESDVVDETTNTEETPVSIFDDKTIPTKEMSPADVMALERAIQLDGGRDPEHYTMPDGRSLATWQRELTKVQTAEGKDSVKVAIETARKQSMAGQNLPKSMLVTMDESGHIVTRGAEKKEGEEDKETPPVNESHIDREEEDLDDKTPPPPPQATTSPTRTDVAEDTELGQIDNEEIREENEERMLEHLEDIEHPLTHEPNES